MNKLERANRLHKLLSERRTPISKQEMCELLECSEATAKRTRNDLKQLGAPIYCTDGVGYSYDKHIDFELLGIWFSHEELHALLTIQHLTHNLSGGLFDESIQHIQKKAESLLGQHMPSAEEMRRICILGTGSRSKTLPMFPIVTRGLLERHRLQLTYHGRQRGEQSEREVSPQRVIHYRGNWYLDAWCHKAKGLRSFAIEKVEKARVLDMACKEILDAELDGILGSSFGIFSGKPKAVAVLHFTKEAARWAADEQWFPDACGHYLDHGIFELSIPYSDATELIMEICRYGVGIKVIEPPELRHQVAKQLQAAADQYS